MLAAEPEPVLAPYPHPVVWTSEPGIELAGVATGQQPGYAFQRLEALGTDSLGVLVRCSACPGAPEGRLPEESLVHTPLPPEVAAWGSLGDFALALRAAAERRDLEALRPIMVPDFSFAFLGPQTPEAAFEVWRSEGFATLDRVAELLDQGMATADGRLWSAPPRFVEEFGYQGVRLGIRRNHDGRWEWLYLIRGIADPERGTGAP